MKRSSPQGWVHGVPCNEPGQALAEDFIAVLDQFSASSASARQTADQFRRRPSRAKMEAMQLEQAAIIKQVTCTAAVIALLLATACTMPAERPDAANTQPAPVVEASAPAAHSDEAEARVADVERTLQAAPAAEPPAENAPSPEPEASVPSQPSTPEPIEADAVASAEEAAATPDDPPAPAPEPETKPAQATAAIPGQSEPTEAPTPEPAQLEPAPAPQAQTMDLDGLETRLRKTKAIGLFTKLELKSQVGELLDDVEQYHRSRSTMNLDQLEEHFNLLVMKLLVLLEQDDPQLHQDIARARPTLWTTLADPDQFLSIRGP